MATVLKPKEYGKELQLSPLRISVGETNSARAAWPHRTAWRRLGYFIHTSECRTLKLLGSQLNGI